MFSTIFLTVLICLSVHGLHKIKDEHYEAQFSKIVQPVSQLQTADKPAKEKTHGGAPKAKKFLDTPDTLNDGEVFDSKHCNPKYCVPYHLCAANKTIITDGIGLLDVRFNPDESCHYLEVCCHPKHQQTESDVSHDEHVDEEKNHKCGYRYKEGMGIQIKEYDHEAQYGEFPWMMAFIALKSYYSTEKEHYFCGGSLIHPEIVLTAAHCVHNYKKYSGGVKVRAGEWDTQTKNEHYPHQDRYIKEVVIHEDFNEGNMHNDIALVFVKDPFFLVGNVRTVCLPPFDYSFDRYTCYGSGWGKDLYGKDGKYAVIMKKRELPIIERSRCENLLRKTRLGDHFLLNKSFLCAGGEKGVDMCKGDGGAPLVCPASKSYDRYFQGGIVAWGIGCGDEKVPGVYVKVSYFRKWIDAVFKKYGYSTKYYVYEKSAH